MGSYFQHTGKERMREGTGSNAQYVRRRKFVSTKRKDILDNLSMDSVIGAFEAQGRCNKWKLK